MIKEQVAEILTIDCYLCKTECETNDDEYCPEQLRIAQQVLNLFKAEVDKLTVIGDDAEQIYIEEHTWGMVDIKMLKREAQLQHAKKQLLDLMGE